jgi:hypothetical protein
MYTRVPRGSQARESTRFWKIEVQVGTKPNRPLARANACESPWRGSFNRTVVCAYTELMMSATQALGILNHIVPPSPRFQNMIDTQQTFNNTGKEPIYGPGALPPDVLLAVQVLAGLTLLLTVITVTSHLRQPSSSLWRGAFRAAWIFWIFAPPIWFSVEYFYLYKPFGKEGTFEAFKYGQELAYRAWLGIAAAMTLLYSQRP